MRHSDAFADESIAVAGAGIAAAAFLARYGYAVQRVGLGAFRLLDHHERGLLNAALPVDLLPDVHGAGSLIGLAAL